MFLGPNSKNCKMCNCNKVWQVGWSKRREKIVKSARSLQIVQLCGKYTQILTQKLHKITKSYTKLQKKIKCVIVIKFGKLGGPKGVRR